MLTWPLALHNSYRGFESENTGDRSLAVTGGDRPDPGGLALNYPLPPVEQVLGFLV